MSVTTMKIPTTQVGAIRDSLATARRELDSRLARVGGAARDAPPATDGAELSRRLEEVDGLLAQIDATAAGQSDWQEVTGSRRALWDAAYDALCAAAERLADDCNEYWRGELLAFELRTLIGEVGARFDLLDGLGPAPAGVVHEG